MNVSHRVARRPAPVDPGRRANSSASCFHGRAPEGTRGTATIAGFEQALHYGGIAEGIDDFAGLDGDRHGEQATETGVAVRGADRQVRSLALATRNPPHGPTHEH